MIFNCAKDQWQYVDYLDPNAVSRYIQLTHQQYFNSFPGFFGETVDLAFYDEPAF